MYVFKYQVQCLGARTLCLFLGLTKKISIIAKWRSAACVTLGKLCLMASLEPLMSSASHIMQLVLFKHNNHHHHIRHHYHTKVFNILITIIIIILMRRADRQLSHQDVPISGVTFDLQLSNHHHKSDLYTKYFRFDHMILNVLMSQYNAYKHYIQSTLSQLLCVTQDKNTLLSAANQIYNVDSTSTCDLTKSLSRQRGSSVWGMEHPFPHIRQHCVPWPWWLVNRKGDVEGGLKLQIFSLR